MRPTYYTDADKYEPVNVIRVWRAGFNIGNVLKYIARAGRKTDDPTEDLQKALTYIQIHIQQGCYDFKGVPSNEDYKGYATRNDWRAIADAWQLGYYLTECLEYLYWGNFEHAAIYIKRELYYLEMGKTQNHD